MTNNQKIIMAIGWLGATYFYLAWKGANLEIQANKKTVLLAERIIIDDEFKQIIHDNDL